MKASWLACLAASAWLAVSAFANEHDGLARNLVYCGVVADVFSRNSAQMREYRDLFLGSATVLTSQAFVVAERNVALTRVEAKIDEAKRAREGVGGSPPPQLSGFMDELKGCLAQIRENRDKIAEGVRKLNEQRDKSTR